MDTIFTIIIILIVITYYAALWMIFQKMGYEGWEGIIPFYNLYILFQELYGDGWRFLLIFIPFYNIYIFIKMYIDLAHAFHKSTGFGVGAVFFPEIFLCILAFGSSSFVYEGRKIHHVEVVKSTEKRTVEDDTTVGPGPKIPPTSNQRHCPNCGKICPSTSRFCGGCGVSLMDSPTLISTFKTGGEATSHVAIRSEEKPSGEGTLPIGFSRASDSDL